MALSRLKWMTPNVQIEGLADTSANKGDAP